MASVTSQTITRRAMALGASCVGLVPVDALLNSPSYRHHRRHLPQHSDGTLVVLALVHPPGQPEMDWWDNWQGGTPGNRRLVNINRRLVKWMRKKVALEAFELPYQVDRNGVFLKDAAILAGLGVMGRNNLLITPRYGPRVRLRALLLNRSLPVPGPLGGFEPCKECPAPCLGACPQDAFAGGSYIHERCQWQMRANEAHPIALHSPVVGMATKFKVAYCRLCELACPVGDSDMP
jgi:epoxyqueuosine reductase